MSSTYSFILVFLGTLTLFLVFGLGILVMRFVVTPLQNFLDVMEGHARNEQLEPVNITPVWWSGLGRITNSYNLLVERINGANERIERLAYCDSLTGLVNREFLFDSAPRILGHPDSAGLFVFVDLNNLKKINDLYGHDFGDSYLCRTANILLGVSRSASERVSSDFFVCRLGGDEFAIILTGDWNTESSLTFLDSLHTSIIGIDGFGGASIGAARFPSDATTLDDLMRLADSAMYATKGNPDHHYCLHNVGVCAPA